MTKKTTPSFDFPHHIDDDKKIVLYNRESWLGNMGARAKLSEIFPDYRLEIASVPVINAMNNV